MKAKKFKFRKAPKMPKSTASAQTWDNFKKKLEEIEKHNKKIAADKRKYLSAIEADKKAKEKIRAKAKSGLGAI